MPELADRFHAAVSAASGPGTSEVPRLVDAMLTTARQAGVSDIHLVPTATAFAMAWRIDGVLQPVSELPVTLAPRVVARLKVLAQLLTYRTDVPQEGRITAAAENPGDETRISTFPTLFGEKAVVRLFVGAGRYQKLDDLGLPGAELARFRELLDQTSGVVVIAGPAGSGKTTTAYAGLRDLADKSGGSRSLVSLEDPIEVVVPGVAQSQVNLPAGFDMPTGLRSLMRQDPEVILVGEIRDSKTAEVVFQAALTGHLVLTTFHAASAAGAINRLSEMGIEPYLLRSTVQGILAQRLLRKLCGCAVPTDDVAARCGLPVAKAFIPQGCENCLGTGYRGRFVLCELLVTQSSDVSRAILARSDASELERLATTAGMVSQRRHAASAVESGLTSAVEVWRALGRGEAVAPS
ncbi:MAG: type II/IV secretion system protein [Planctomycetaceae bacterium]|nr:MAG: type II/IV secretion system protein [Planctomycetaceae bacterium]